MDDILTGLTKGCSIIYTLRPVTHLQLCFGKESSCSLKFMAAEGQEEATSIVSVPHLFPIYQGWQMIKPPSYFIPKLLIPLCMHQQLCCWNHTALRAGLKWTAPLAPGCQQQDTHVPRMTRLSSRRNGLQLRATHSKSLAQREKHRDNRNTKTCFFRTWLLKLNKTRKYMKWQQGHFFLNCCSSLSPHMSLIYFQLCSSAISIL